MTAMTNPMTPAPPVGRRGIWSWMLFDWAAQPFHTLIITFVFAPYFAANVAADPIRGQADWAMAATIGGLIIACLAPVMGALSDATGPRKPWIAAFAAIGIVAVFSLWFVTPDNSSGNLAFALIAFVIALIGFEFAAIFNNAMMPGLVGRDRLGGLSGNAWALGYAGGLICLILMLALMIASPETGRTLVGLEPVLGLDPQAHEGDRAAGPLSALWFLVFIIPLFMFTPDAPRRADTVHAVRNGLKHLARTVRTLPRNRSLFAFLGASMFYRDALNGVYAFGGIYLVGVMGWSTIQIGVFGIIGGLAGVAGCMLGGWLDNRIGTKRVVTICIIVLIIASILVVSTTPEQILFVPVTPGSGLVDATFYLIGVIIGGAGGALQSASRPLLVDQIERPEAMGEAFGLYALSGRATAFLAPLGIWLMTEWSGSQQIGIAPVVVLFVIGLLLLIPVRSRT